MSSWRSRCFKRNPSAAFGMLALVSNVYQQQLTARWQRPTGSFVCFAMIIRTLRHSSDVSHRVVYVHVGNNGRANKQTAKQSCQDWPRKRNVGRIVEQSSEEKETRAGKEGEKSYHRQLKNRRFKHLPELPCAHGVHPKQQLCSG